MEFERAKLDIDRNVGIITLNHPEVMNAVSTEMIGGIVSALNEAQNPQHGIRCLILTGAGRGFCAGANLQPSGAATGNRDAGSVLETHYHPMLRKMRELAMPIVSAVNGAAAGVGMSLALMGDLVLCARSAYFLQAFRRIGLVPDGGSTWILPRLVGRARAMELSMLGEKLPAEKALEWGLIYRVVDDAKLMDDAKALAHDLANGPTVSLSLIRKLYWDSEENTYEQQLNLERQMQGRAGKSKDFAEGVRAFLEKRPAKFKGE
ncbi:MAG TPA: enoyl-CoA hydratase/isomerase [Candidatus Binataceae bacterium]|nr:enoyl-CoA hydratase/isomerase [Candidatus Binataceae bacterium]